jgi:TetR/AcrR family transcriptional repressor of nem operon
MRSSREQAEKNRQGVIDTASQLFRERGFDGIGVIELMGAAGMTKGAFYKQFDSKEDLTAQASRRSMEMATGRWVAAVDKHPDAPLEAVIDMYLSREHRDEKAEGCPLVALGADAARQGPDVKASFEEGVTAHLSSLRKLIPAMRNDKNEDKEKVVLALMVGALTLSRMVNDESLSRSFLDAAAAQIRTLAKS